MNDEINLQVPEGGPIDQMGDDDALLQQSGRGHGDTSLAEAFRQWKEERDLMAQATAEDKLPTFNGGAGEQLITDAVMHPTELVYDWGLLNLIPGFVKPMAAGMGLYAAGLNDMLREGDEQYAKFVNHMINNPGDWYHLIRGATMGEPASPEELQKTFEPMRP